jgi:hypothetical protein
MKGRAGAHIVRQIPHSQAGWKLRQHFYKREEIPENSLQQDKLYEEKMY